ncbi:MAG: hypothetical protein ACFB51_08835 [Anaerolineae bacterium]
MMQDEQRTSEIVEATQPFFYEIRVKGRLSEERWTAWFSYLEVLSDDGESVLRGSLPDHAALYGLLARLRDLAIPLLSVNVLDAEARRKLSAKSRRLEVLLNLTLLAIYLALVGGMVAVTVFFTSGGYLHTALALAGLFALSGVLAYASSLWSGFWLWRWLTYAAWLGSVICFFIYAALVNLVPTALSIALMLFLGAGGLIYLVSYLRSQAKQAQDTLITWESLGERQPLDRPTEPEKQSRWSDGV